MQRKETQESPKSSSSSTLNSSEVTSNLRTVDVATTERAQQTSHTNRGSLIAKQAELGKQPVHLEARKSLKKINNLRFQGMLKSKDEHKMYAVLTAQASALSAAAENNEIFKRAFKVNLKGLTSSASEYYLQLNAAIMNNHLCRQASPIERLKVNLYDDEVVVPQQSSRAVFSTNNQNGDTNPLNQPSLPQTNQLTSPTSLHSQSTLQLQQAFPQQQVSQYQHQQQQHQQLQSQQSLLMKQVNSNNNQGSSITTSSSNQNNIIQSSSNKTKSKKRSGGIRRRSCYCDTSGRQSTKATCMDLLFPNTFIKNHEYKPRKKVEKIGSSQKDLIIQNLNKNFELSNQNSAGTTTNASAVVAASSAAANNALASKKQKMMSLDPDANNTNSNKGGNGMTPKIQLPRNSTTSNTPNNTTNNNSNFANLQQQQQRSQFYNQNSIPITPGKPSGGVSSFSQAINNNNSNNTGNDMNVQVNNNSEQTVGVGVSMTSSTTMKLSITAAAPDASTQFLGSNNNKINNNRSSQISIKEENEQSQYQQQQQQQFPLKSPTKQNRFLKLKLIEQPSPLSASRSPSRNSLTPNGSTPNHNRSNHRGSATNSSTKPIPPSPFKRASFDPQSSHHNRSSLNAQSHHNNHSNTLLPPNSPCNQDLSPSHESTENSHSNVTLVTNSLPGFLEKRKKWLAKLRLASHLVGIHERQRKKADQNLHDSEPDESPSHANSINEATDSTHVNRTSTNNKSKMQGGQLSEKQQKLNAAILTRQIIQSKKLRFNNTINDFVDCRSKSNPSLLSGALFLNSEQKSNNQQESNPIDEGVMNSSRIQLAAAESNNNRVGSPAAAAGIGIQSCSSSSRNIAKPYLKKRKSFNVYQQSSSLASLLPTNEEKKSMYYFGDEIVTSHRMQQEKQKMIKLKQSNGDDAQQQQTHQQTLSLMSSSRTFESGSNSLLLLNSSASKYGFKKQTYQQQQQQSGAAKQLKQSLSIVVGQGTSMTTTTTTGGGLDPFAKFSSYYKTNNFVQKESSYSIPQSAFKKKSNKNPIENLELSAHFNKSSSENVAAAAAHANANAIGGSKVSLPDLLSGGAAGSTLSSSAISTIASNSLLLSNLKKQQQQQNQQQSQLSFMKKNRGFDQIIQQATSNQSTGSSRKLNSSNSSKKWSHNTSRERKGANQQKL